MTIKRTTVTEYKLQLPSSHLPSGVIRELTFTSWEGSDAITEEELCVMQDALNRLDRKGSCVGKWHVPDIRCRVCGEELNQCPECRVIAGHRHDCSKLKEL